MLSYKVDEENVANYIAKHVFVFQTRCPLTICISIYVECDAFPSHVMIFIWSSDNIFRAGQIILLSSHSEDHSERTCKFHAL